MVGAILVQNTSWRNVEIAITNLRAHATMDAQYLYDLDVRLLADLIRSSGFHNVKARRVQNVLAWYLRAGGLAEVENIKTPALRESLLNVDGIGEETADAILVYAFGRASFVIDAYTRRVLSRLGLAVGDERYTLLQSQFHQSFADDVECFAEYHALFVEHAKRTCKKIPDCDACTLLPDCNYAQALR